MLLPAIEPNLPDPTFKEFVLDQLSALPELRARAMFGGHGLYSGAHCFGIVIEGQLYFKVDAANRLAFVERGMKPFTFVKGKQVLSLKYYEVPPDGLEDRTLAIVWANRSLQVAALAEGRKRTFAASNAG